MERSGVSFQLDMGEGKKSFFWPVVAAVSFIAAIVGLICFVIFVLDQRFLIWLTNLPVAVIHVGIIIFWLLFTLIVWWIAERTIDHDVRDKHNENVQRLLLVSSSFFVFFLGFIVSQEWENVINVRSDLSSVAVAIDTAAYKAEALPDPERSEVKGALANLGRSIACKELLTIQESGNGDPETTASLRNAFLAVVEVPPWIRQQSIFQDLLDEIGSISDYRGQVLAGAASGMPPVMLITIFFIGGLFLTLFVVQLAKGQRSHLLMTSGLILLISVGTVLVLSLARPFGGTATVGQDYASATRQAYSDCSLIKN